MKPYCGHIKMKGCPLYITCRECVYRPPNSINDINKNGCKHINTHTTCTKKRKINEKEKTS